MKKLLGILAFGLLLFSFACSERRESFKVEKQQELLSSLNDFNDSLLILRPETRSGFMRFLYVVSADAAGAYELGSIGGKVGALCGGPQGALIGAGIGGLIGGAGMSYGAYCGTRGLVIKDALSSKQLITSAYLELKQNNQLIVDYSRDNIRLAFPAKFGKVLM